MAGAIHAPQIDLGFGKRARELKHFGVRFRAGNFLRKRFHLLGPGRIPPNGPVQAVTKRVCGGSGAN